MTNLLQNSEEKKKLLKHMMLELHRGEAPDEVRKQLARLLQSIPYNDVVEVEQELINEGIPAEEVLEFCDIHTQVLDGHIDHSEAKEIPAGHPVDTFKNENAALMQVIHELQELYQKISDIKAEELEEYWFKIKKNFHDLADVEKHYLRKEYLLFPFLEKYDITGPPKVMWGKHDETRELLKSALMGLQAKGKFDIDEVVSLIEFVFQPTSNAIREMISKEEEILFPMAMDKLTDKEWYEIHTQSNEYGYCLFDPVISWIPEGVEIKSDSFANAGKIKLPSGILEVLELKSMLNTLPIEITFIDADDKVKYFSQSKHKIFARSRAIIGRDVRLCHPPKSVGTVEQIISNFKSGKENSAPFWINIQNRFIHIEYFAVRDEHKRYLGTVEVVQDLTELRKLEGEKRLLSYAKK